MYLTEEGMKDRGRDSTRGLGKMWCQQEASSCLIPRRALECNHRVDPALKQGAVLSIPVSSAAGCFTGAGRSREEGGTISPARLLPPAEENSLGEGAFMDSAANTQKGSRAGD